MAGIKRLSATRFLKAAERGKNKPLLLASDDSDPPVEFFAKFSHRCERKCVALAMEMFGAQLAHDVGVPVPMPFVVDLPEELRELLPDGLRPPFGDTPGFGSRKVTNYVEWSPAHQVSSHSLPAALAVLLLDVAAENGDRRETNPNLLVVDGQLHAIDHELLFPGLGSIGQPSCWQPGGATWVGNGQERHALFGAVRGKRLDFTAVRDKWLALRRPQLEDYTRDLPAEWLADPNPINAAIDRVMLVQERIDDCIAELGRVLQ